VVAVSLREMRRRLLPLAVLAVLAFAATAAADGDPASDVLYLKNVYLPYPAPPAAAGRALQQAVAQAYVKRFRIKVAVIATAPDLGAVPELFNKPTQYAKFLGTELQSFYVGPLLIAMPAGFGIYDGGRSTAAEERVLATTTPRVTSADELTRLSANVVRRLTAVGALRSKDITKPFTLALPSSGSRGGTARLRFSATDDSMRSRIQARITSRAGATIATLRTAMRVLEPQRITALTWHARRTAPKQLRFCVVAIDGAGNRSARACASLKLR
jgi:hypothetical protein